MRAEHTWRSEGVGMGDTEHYVKSSDLVTSLYASYMPSLWSCSCPSLDIIGAQVRSWIHECWPNAEVFT